MIRASQPAVLADAHVHLHDCFEPDAFFAAAHANLAAQAGLLGAATWHGLLLFTETASADCFGRLAAGALDGLSASWQVRPLPEPVSLELRGPAGERLFVVGGRQILTREGLEVLALGMPERIADGTSVREAIGAATAADAVSVLAWGNGKWIGARSAIVRALIEGAQPGDFFLGDNSGRLRWAPAPREFARAEQRGLYLLPGSDPLPFASEVRKVGSYGFWLRTELEEEEHPFAWLRDRLRSDPRAIQPFGEREQLLPFFRNQVAMQIRKRFA